MNWNRIFLAILAMSILSRLFGSDLEQRKIQIQQHESAAASTEALDRRLRSTDLLKSKGVPTIDHLPVIEDTASARIRTIQEIVERFVACTICAVGGETGDSAFVQKLLAEFDASRLLSPAEREFVVREISDQGQRVQFSWRYERSWVLLWAVGYIERLDYPPSICDVPKLAGLLKGRSVAQLVDGAKLRSEREILDEADLIYRLNWAVVDDRANGTKKVPREVVGGVVQERHSALNWLIGYMDQEWDEITTDT